MLSPDASEANHERQKLLVKAATQLGEHFSAVQILASRSEDGAQSGTTRFEASSGSFYERFGSVRAWLLRQDEAERMAARAELDEDEGVA